VKKTSAFILLLLCAILIISGCSSSTQTNENSSENTNDQNEEAVEPKDLVVAFGAEPLTVDPQNADDAMSNQANVLLYDKLVTFDPDNKIIPELATEWSTSEDGMKITFKLRDDVVFQDGTPFNAEAVKVNFERVINETNQLSRHSLYAEFISKIVVDSEFQVTIELIKPYGPAISAFAHGAGGIISPKAIQENQDLDTTPAGTGPYKLKSWTPGTEMVFEPNENYWGAKSQLKSITFKPVPENSSRSIMLENGEVDVIAPIGTQDVERLQQNDELTVDLAPIYRNLYLSINTRKPLFQDVKVRQALNYAVDKETIVNKILLGQGKVASAPVGSSLNGYSDVGNYEYDPEKAKQLLDEAGVKPGTKIKLWTPDGRYLMDSKITEFIQANLSEVGFEVEFQKWEWSAYAAELDNQESEFDLMIGSWGASTGDIDWGLRPLLTTDGNNNYGDYSNPKVDELIQKGLGSSDADERLKIYNEAMTIIKEDAPWVFIAEYTQPVGISKNVENIYTWGNGYTILRDAVKK
jgi:ABC-type transport system substrate-binding protein